MLYAHCRLALRACPSTIAFFAEIAATTEGFWDM
jgi:hypothetical protein